MTEDLLLEFDNVSFHYPDGNMGLTGCSLNIQRGTRNALLGANGAGKTTLFLHANGLLRPQSGIVRYAGQAIDTSRASLRQFAAPSTSSFKTRISSSFRRACAKMSPSAHSTSGWMSTLCASAWNAALQDVGIEELADRPVHNLSFGQKKRVCIAGVLAMAPQLMILDEPMAGLDHAMRAELLAVFDRLHAQGITLFLATHDIDFAYRWADRVHVMVHGQCTASFDAANLAEQNEALSSAGLPMPGIIELQRQLATQGLLTDEQSPRSINELIELIKHRRSD